MVRQTDDYEKYYVPKVVSIGPYHYGKPKLQLVEKHKPAIATKLLKNNKETLRSLYNKLGEPQMVQDLRSYYEKDSTTMFSNKEFTKMMLLDGCFVLHYIDQFNYLVDDYPELKGSQINFASQDLFLLENQIPFKVLREVAQMTEFDLRPHIMFVIFRFNNIITFKGRVTQFIFVPRGAQGFELSDHLLQILRSYIIEKVVTNHVDPLPPSGLYLPSDNRVLSILPGHNFRNVSELVDIGIHFKPSEFFSLSSVYFSKTWLRFKANVILPRMTVNGSTRHMLLNLIAYETCVCSVKDAQVTSYVCLLDSLIDHAEDVKILRKAWVLDTSLGSDEEVATLFNEIATDLTPNNWAYMETRNQIQIHYESWSNTLFSQLKNEYFKSPWAIFVLLGALIALFLSAAQTYLTRWSPKGECDDLCSFLKKNHHL